MEEEGGRRQPAFGFTFTPLCVPRLAVHGGSHGLLRPIVVPVSRNRWTWYRLVHDGDRPRGQTKAVPGCDREARRRPGVRRGAERQRVVGRRETSPDGHRTIGYTKGSPQGRGDHSNFPWAEWIDLSGCVETAFSPRSVIQTRRLAVAVTTILRSAWDNSEDTWSSCDHGERAFTDSGVTFKGHESP